MNAKVKAAIVIVLLVLLVGGGGYYFYQSTKTNLVSSFTLPDERIARDLEGRTAPLPYGQVWPFDPTQGITVRVVSKKQVDDYVQVIVDIGAKADVVPPKNDKGEEKAPPPGVKSFRVSLSGLVRLTYERINSEWYLIGVENISLKASPLVNE